MASRPFNLLEITRLIILLCYLGVKARRWRYLCEHNCLPFGLGPDGDGSFCSWPASFRAGVSFWTCPFAGRDVPHALALGERAGPTSPLLAFHDAEVGEPSPARAFGMKAACSRSTRSSAFYAAAVRCPSLSC